MIGNPIVVKKEEAQAETFSVSVTNATGASMLMVSAFDVGSVILSGMTLYSGQQSVLNLKKIGDFLVFPSTSASIVSGDGIRYRKDSDTLTVVFTGKTDAITIT